MRYRGLCQAKDFVVTHFLQAAPQGSLGVECVYLYAVLSSLAQVRPGPFRTYWLSAGVPAGERPKLWK